MEVKLITIQFNSPFLYVISTDIDSSFVNFIRHWLKVLHHFCDLWHMENFAHKPCRHVCNQNPQKTAYVSLIIAIKSEANISTFHKGKIIQTNLHIFRRFRTNVRTLNCYFHLRTWLRSQVWEHEMCGMIFILAVLEVNAECKLTTVQPYASWPRNPV